MSRAVCIVLWAGGVGGAETLMGDFAVALKRRSVDVSILCVGDSMPLGGRLSETGTPCFTLGHRRGAAVVLHPRRSAAAVQELGPDGAIVNASGYLPWLIELGGYRGPMLAVEHGDVLNLHLAPARRRARVRAERWLCARSRYRDIAVSDTMLTAFQEMSGKARTGRIYNGVDLVRFAPRRTREPRDGELRIGVASRLTPGKGIDVLLRACALIGADHPWSLWIAGEGPQEHLLRLLTRQDPTLRERVRFCGALSDMPGFWSDCDVAVVASSEWAESFSMSAVEAMACGVPVIASKRGALPEICGPCATLVAPGDVEGLSGALLRYLCDAELREGLGAAGRRRVEEIFDIDRMVDRYLEALGLRDAQPTPTSGFPSSVGAPLAEPC